MISRQFDSKADLCCCFRLVSMTQQPKPRSVRGHALFALIVSIALVLVFQVMASDGVGWGDVAVALAGALLLVAVIAILDRRRSKAVWVDNPTWKSKLLFGVGGIFLGLGLLYADSCLLHPRDLTPARFRQDVVLGAVAFGVPALVVLISELRKRKTSTR